MLAGKAFSKTFTKPKDIRAKQQRGTWQWVNLGARRGYVCQSSLSERFLFISICLSPVLLNSPFIQFISLLLGKVKFNNAYLYRKVYAYSWIRIIVKFQLSQHWSWQKAIKCTYLVEGKKKSISNAIFCLDHIWNTFWQKINHWKVSTEDPIFPVYKVLSCSSK